MMLIIFTIESKLNTVHQLQNTGNHHKSYQSGSEQQIYSNYLKKMF